MSSKANELLSGLWIGDTDILNSKKFMTDNQIDIILNCTQLFDFPDLDLQKIRLPFSNDKNILIVCYDGKSISPFIVYLYIAEYSKIDKRSIYNIMLTKDGNLSLWYDLSLFYNY